jgi:Protein of unknown function (DUF1592)/Protein of unknown function (DUF1588)/Protein of unknown function (DUF1587)/Protein of unknown function (DUF1585)/Protein of unknown function (DUF1595)/Planctomycete cytochrome C
VSVAIYLTEGAEVRRPSGFPALLLIGGVLLAGASLLPAQTSPQHALINQYCVTCHNEKAKVGGLALDKADIDHAGEHAEVWEKVVRKLRGGMMPPQGMPRPEQAKIEELIGWLQTSLDQAATAHPEPGRSALHRLNRTEYSNAIRDLLGLKMDVSALLPADDESNGFDNIAEVLRVSPSLLEAYLSASREVSSLAVGDPKTAPISQSFRVPPDMAQEGHIEGLPLGTRGGILIHHNFPLDADYEFNVFLLRNIVGYLTGMEFPHQLEVSIDGTRVFLAPVGGEEDLKLVDTNLALAGDTLDARLRTKVHVKAGPHDVAVAFLRRDSAESDEPLQPFTRDLDLQNMNGIPLIDHVQVTGPFNATGSGDTPSRKRIFVCAPANSKDEVACATRILSTLARRAYRRPVTDADMETLLSFYQTGKNQGGNFESGIENALRLILASPKFLFRSEPDPARVAAGSVYHVSDLELASRLSFFLWSSIPDDELLTVAAQGKLKDPAVLDRQVRRMLADPKAEALVNNFAEQWLFLRNVQSVAPDEATFPNFDDNLRQSFRRETELFFESIVKEDRDVMDLITANYTFVNERLAKHYNIPNVYGSQFRRVTLTNDARRGLLGQGSILSVTSYPTRTSPVLRGKWIMENLMGTPPPAPPPNVPALKDQAQGGKILSVRQLMEEHRKNAPCSTCHAVLDPLGFALETFNAVGEFRTKDASGPIDASGKLADGTAIDGVIGLREALLKHPEYFVGTLTEKMLTYALGRPLEYYDMPVVRGIVANAAHNDYRFSSLITSIVKSQPFEMKKAIESTDGVTTAAVRRSVRGGR